MTCFPSSPWRRAAVFLAVSALAALPARGAVDPVGAAAVFKEAATICARDGGALWGHSLCGPILLVDPQDGSAIASQADAGGVLKPAGGLFAGTLPPTVIVANTPIEWSGTRWTEMLWPLPEDEAHRHVMIAHELFHRVQVDLKMVQADGGNAHLDTLEGRILLQLEWQALAKALASTAAPERRAAIADALLFRRERQRRFPDAAAEEGALESNEGVAEYTGVRVGLETLPARVAYAIRDLSAFVQAPTFVRSFAYATGPAYGLLLDDADPGWRAEVRAGRRMDQLLAAALSLPESSTADVRAREAAYDPTLRPRELRRDEDKRARLAALRAKLVDGPVLVVSLAHASYQFNPQTLQPLGDAGIVYPTARLSADWGVLEVDGGALMDKGMKAAAVSAAGIAASRRSGDGWRLTLNPGWDVKPGARAGDLVVEKTGN